MTGSGACKAVATIMSPSHLHFQSCSPASIPSCGVPNGRRLQTELRAGDISVNLLTREVIRAGRRIDLQAREFALLELFLRNAGRVLTKTFLLERLWDYSFDPQTNVVDVLVCRLRGKMDRDFEKKVIQTIRGAGYVLKVG